MQEQTGARARFQPGDTVDFAIVGSGAAGGIIAKELSTAGFTVIVLEQGPRLTETQFDHDEFGTFMRSRNSNDPATQPQTFRPTASDPAQKGLALIYGRLVGGSNAHFTANFWRLRPTDFNEASTLGGVPGTALADWPLTYEELEPYYTKAEWELGVSGVPGPFDPARSKPYPMPPLPVKSSGVLMDRGARALGLHSQPAPMAINSQYYNGRPACQHCGFCLFFMCEFRSKSTSMVTMLPIAEASGRCEIRPESYVAKVEIGRDGRATGVTYFDNRRRLHLQKARAVVLCANGAEKRNGFARAEVLGIPAAGELLPVDGVVAALRARGLRRLFVEGGGVTVSRFLEARALDRLHLTVSSVFLGAGRPGVKLPGIDSLDAALRPRVRRFTLGDDVLFDCDFGA
jgi:choline dehydrogenase-like flavoprotein